MKINTFKLWTSTNSRRMFSTREDFRHRVLNEGFKCTTKCDTRSFYMDVLSEISDAGIQTLI